MLDNFGLDLTNGSEAILGVARDTELFLAGFDDATSALDDRTTCSSPYAHLWTVASLMHPWSWWWMTAGADEMLA